MSTTLKTLSRTLTIAAALLAAAPAHAVLQDHGPADPVLVWPQWYRDLGGTAVGLCKSQAQSPNAAAGLASMCFPITPYAPAFAGNVGDEIFYSNLTVLVNGTGYSLRYVAAVEAAYVPGPHPVHGQEIVFARLRWVMNVSVPGTYIVTHPYGVEVFPDVPANGPRSLFSTIDVPLAPNDFDGALSGRVGPFIRWDVLNPGESLTVGAEQFLGDPNYEHTYTGSPFGTNYVRVDGPPGSNLDGAGNDFIVQPLGNVLGQVWTAPIPTPFTVKKAVYTRTATQNSVDVWATSAPGQRLIATGTDMPSFQLTEFPAGQYYGHIERSSAAFPPATVTVTNISSNPTVQATVPLADQLDATATYDKTTGRLDVSAVSSDSTNPVLAIVGVGAGLMTTPAAPGGTYTYSVLLPTSVEPPLTINVQSNAGGLYQAKPLVLPTGVDAAGQPVAADDLGVAVAGSGTTAIPVTVNDAFAGAVSILVLTQPVTGTAVASGTSVNFTPRAGASGPDSFTYVLQDVGGISNVATVTFTVPFVAAPPTANADNTATQTGTTRTVNVLANDVASTGTTIDPLSVQVTGAGASVNPLTGVVSYTAGGATGTFTFTYTVANTAGTRSAPATVTMVVFGGPESVSFSKLQYGSSRWTVTGSTNWASTSLTQATATCWTGTAAAPTASTLIGSAPIDTTGKFQLTPVATPVPTNPSSATCKTTYGGSRSQGVTFK